jgi:hypothetical protein
VAQFPFNTQRAGLRGAADGRGIQLVHKFAASHHFKGPHHAYGKDAKFICRTAERNQKARLASTFDVYDFGASNLPKTRSRVV